MTVEALAAAQVDRTARLQDKVRALVAEIWVALTGIDDAAMDQWLTAVLPVVAGAEQVASADMAAYLALMVAEMTGQPPVYVGVPAELVTGAHLRRGTSPEEVYARPMVQARSLLAQGLPYAETMTGAGRRAELLATTDVQSARLYASQAIMVREPRIVGYRRKLSGSHSCGLCVVASTRRYHKADLMPRHPGCVVSGTSVVGQASAATRRWYIGEGIVLWSASGNQLTVTPNHPILTGHGWVPAGLLQEGDHVLSGDWSYGPGVDIPDQHQVPALIEDRFRALAVARLATVPITSEDFHGDGPHGQVNVVATDGLLCDYHQALVSQPAGQLLLTLGMVTTETLSSLGYKASFGFGVNSTPSRFVGRSGLGFPFSLGHSECPEKPSLGAVADRVSSFNYGPIQSTSGDQEVLAHRQSGLTVDIAGYGFGRNDRMPHGHLDRLVSVRRVGLAGMVYNLQTVTGWYEAGGIIVHNCDCTPTPIIGTRDPGAVLNRPLLDQAHASIAERFGPEAVTLSADSAAYRGLVTVYEHGEYGPTLAAAGDHHLISAAASAR